MVYTGGNVREKTMRLVLALLCLITVSAGGEDWKAYHNARFGFLVEYPPTLLRAQPEAGNGDGRELHAVHGAARMAVWGQWLIEPTQFSSELASAEAECAGGHASYKLVHPTVWVVSCPTAKGEILYIKGLRSRDAESRFEAHYPASEKPVWDSVVARMAGALNGPHPPD